MPSVQLLQRRIKSVKSTRQITKAMELVAASKMRKATEFAEQGRSYREAMPVTAAAAEIRRCTGTQFDPRVADALLAIVLDAPDAGAVRAPVPQLQHVPLSTAAAR